MRRRERGSKGCSILAQLELVLSWRIESSALIADDTAAADDSALTVARSIRSLLTNGNDGR
jgi:uncharacterized protein YacL